MSVRSDRVAHWLIAVTLVVVVGAIASVITALAVPKTTVRLGDGVFSARLAQAPDQRAKGLSGVSNLGRGEAMLLVYDSDDTWQIWMKDMKIPLDIIWLDSDKEVVYIVKNAQPDGYPKQQFEPKRPARYVLEVAAGTTDERNIMIGDQAEFDLANRQMWWQ